LSEDIADRARQLSKRELLRFGAYVENYGIQITVVGGWAVYAYNPYLESVDIDVVTPHDRVPDVESILTQQCGWVPTTTDTPIWKRFSKRIPGGGPRDCALFDLLSANLINAFHEDNHRTIPFHTCLQENHYVRRSIDDQVSVNVPRKELLLLYKLKSYRDRIFDLHSKAENELERLRLRAKATKDLSDTIALMDPTYGPLDLMSLRGLVGNQDLQFLAATVGELPSHIEAMGQYRGASTTNVRSWVQRVLDAFR